MQDYKQKIQELMKQPDNCMCADCKREKSAWASTNLGVFICIKCSGIHRSLGTHISFIRSCTLDSWTKEQYESMLNMGNKKANEYWEANLPADFLYPQINDTKGMEAFIKDKYQLKKYIDPTKQGSQNNEGQKTTSKYSIRKRASKRVGK